MDNSALAARRLGIGATMALVATALVVAAVIAFQRPASAQAGFGFDIRAIVCPIFNALASAFGGFLRGILSSIAAAFGCGSISG